MKKPALTLAAIVSLTACPQQEPITSVNGLEGGTLISKLAAPELKTELLNATSVTADEIAAPAASIDALTAQSVTTTALDVRQMTAGAILFGLPLGVVEGFTPSTLEQDALGYEQADAACRQAFADEFAHVCSSAEAMFALRGAQRPEDAIFDGAAVNTFSFQIVGRETGADPQNRNFVVNDCDGWTSARDTTEARIADPDDASNDRRSDLGTFPVESWIDGYMTLFAGRSTASWRLRPNIFKCQDVKLACCG